MSQRLSRKVFFFYSSDEKAPQDIPQSNGNKTGNNLKRFRSEGQAICRYVVHICHNVVKSAEDKSGDEKPYEEDLWERSAFEFFPDQNGIAYQDGAEKSHYYKTYEIIIQLQLPHCLETFSDFAFQAGEMGNGRC